MQITDSGDLVLHEVDLSPESKKLVSPIMTWIDLAWFTIDSQTAVWYARQTKAKIAFACFLANFDHGLRCPVAGPGYFCYPKGYRQKPWDKKWLSEAMAQVAETKSRRKS